MAEPNANAVAFGPGLLYIAPIGTAEPTTVSTTLDAAWVPLGYTNAGSTFSVAPTVTDLYAAEEIYPLASPVTAIKATMAFALLETTKRNLSAVFNAGVVVPDGSIFKFEPPAPGTELNVMLLWKSKNNPANSLPEELLLLRKCFSGGTTSVTRNKGVFAGLDAVFNMLAPGGGVAPWAWFGQGDHNTL